ncbi:MAG: hypothetical protein Q8M75_08440 [Polynucleobacter sp.]|nr:hypothetical protein [Polynucleobacter sp.]
MPGAAATAFCVGGGKSDLGWADACDAPMTNAAAKGMQAINLPIRKYRLRI